MRRTQGSWSLSPSSILLLPPRGPRPYCTDKPKDAIMGVISDRHSNTRWTTSLVSSIYELLVDAFDLYFNLECEAIRILGLPEVNLRVHHGVLRLGGLAVLIRYHLDGREEACCMRVSHIATLKQS